MLHFRSHRRSTFDLDARPVAFFGANGAGKTNVLEAVSFLSPGRGLRRARAADVGQRPGGIGWQVRASLHRDGRAHDVAVRAEGDAARKVLLEGKAAAQVQLGRLAPVLWLVPAMDRLWIEGAEGRRRFLDRITMSFRPEHAQASLDYERAMRQRNRLLKDQVADKHWYRALEAQMAEAGVAVDTNRRHALGKLHAAQQGAATAFPAADLALVQNDLPLPGDAAGFQDLLAGNRLRDLAAGRSLVGPHRSDLAATYAEKGQPAAECSTGEQKALLVSLVLSNARALAAQTGAAPLLLLDEVGAHLDTGRRAALFDEICALGAQAWVTGTEAAVFDSFGTRAQRFEVTETGGQSQVRPQ